jgi:hypothetical protein
VRPSGADTSAERAPPVAHLPYPPGLDGLHALAVTGVLIYHAGLGLRGGFLGVEAFFVLSGYLITALLLAEWQRDGQINLLAFWRRRARRLLPMLDVVLVGTLGLSALFVPAELAEVGADTLAALGYVTNWWLVLRGQPYFDPMLRPPLSSISGRWPSKSSSTWPGRFFSSFPLPRWLCPGRAHHVDRSRRRNTSAGQGATTTTWRRAIALDWPVLPWHLPLALADLHAQPPTAGDTLQRRACAGATGGGGYARRPVLPSDRGTDTPWCAFRGRACANSRCEYRAWSRAIDRRRASSQWLASHTHHHDDAKLVAPRVVSCAERLMFGSACTSPAPTTSPSCSGRARRSFQYGSPRGRYSAGLAGTPYAACACWM